MIKKTVIAVIALLLMGVLVVSCKKAMTDSNTTKDNPSEDKIVIGFSQLGAESDWRSANTKSIREAFTEENGYRLIFQDAQQKQVNQITAIRMFIQQEVDYILLAPVTETGWDTVLQEAKNAGIPVIIVDRMVDVEDESLFTCWVGSDFELEGKKATKWLETYINAKGYNHKDINIVNIQGTLGASAQIGRSKALQDAAQKNDWNLLAEVPGDFTRAKGREVMEKLLKEYKEINVVYCENDNEAFGAIEAIEAAGKKVGYDIENGEIMIISFDGVNEEALKYIREGKIACIAECDPMHGNRLEILITYMDGGGKPNKFNNVNGKVYSGYDHINIIEIDGKSYGVKILGMEENTYD